MKNHQWLPSFLGIGGTRCGSTWLHYNLLAHPQMWLPPVKELHYFDRSTAYQSPSYLASERLSERLFGRESHHADWRKRARNDVTRALLRHVTTLPWHLKYYFGRPSDAWYASLFKQGANKLRGEITPGYAFLNARDVAHIRSLMPDARIILFLRNPVDRLWSQYRKKFLSDSQFRQKLEGPELDQRSDFLSILSTWESIYPQRQMLVDFYDEIEADPAGLLTRVYKFLGVDASAERMPPSLHERLNAAPARPMPDDVKIALTRKYLAQFEGLSDRFGGHASKWLADARAILGQRGGTTQAA